MSNGVARQSHYAAAFRAPDDSIAHRTDVALSQMAQQAHERAAGRYYEEKQQQEQQMQHQAPPSFRPASSAARTASNGYALQLGTAQQQQQPYERTASGRLVPALDIARVSERGGVEYEQPRRQSTGGGGRPGSAQPLGRQQPQHPPPPPQQPPQAIGVTLVPTTVYRPPSGTSLTKVPHSARARDQIARDLLETRERLRAKALDKRIREATTAQGSQQQQQRTAKPRAKSAKKASGGAASSARRHAEQQQRAEQAFFSADQIAALQQPYEPQSQRAARPQSAGGAAYQANILRGSQAQAQMFAPNGQPIIQPGSARPSSARPAYQQQQQQPQPQQQQQQQPQQWGRAYDASDRVGQLVSSSPQSRLSASDVSAQPVAGKPSGSNGGELASILGGGHENLLAFGNRNAPSAQTRIKINDAPAAPMPNQQNYIQPPSQGSTSARRASDSSPFALSITSFSGLGSPARRFNDDSGAVVVRDNLSDEVHHASASLGYGKQHVGYRAYVCEPAAATFVARGKPAGTNDIEEAESLTVRPSILAWHTADDDNDGGAQGSSRGSKGKSREEVLKRLQREAWSRTSGDYGGTLVLDPSVIDPRDRPVAGATKPPHEPLQLSYAPDQLVPSGAGAIDATARARATARAQAGVIKHVHGPGCGHAINSSRNVPVRAGAGQGNGNPLNPYSSEELAGLATGRGPTNLGAAALGFGKKHSAYKTHVLTPSAKLEETQAY